MNVPLALAMSAVAAVVTIALLIFSAWAIGEALLWALRRLTPRRNGP